MQRLLQILFWSVIAAAFIGPGTVTTASSSGAQFGFSLLWALVFSTVACLVLQEASARITIVSGMTLAQAIRQRYRGGVMNLFILMLILGAVILGCAAYEAGNILGSVAGASLGTGISPKFLTVAIGVLAGILLFLGSTKGVARILGGVVALMGIAFLVTAVLIRPSLPSLLKGLFTPRMPENSGIMILGLIGTTVVPYNLFLGSGLARGQKLKEFRFGLYVAVIFGGIISMGVLVVGTAVTGAFSFSNLAAALSTRLGSWASLFFAIGLFAAGFSSAVTAPMAAAITARGLFERESESRWQEQMPRYRAVWMGVLVFGIIFGLVDVKPIPAIILAQALNGILLPFVTIFLFIVVNDPDVMTIEGVNSMWKNILMGLVAFVTVVLGVWSLLKAASSVFGFALPDSQGILFISGGITLLLACIIIHAILRRRRLKS